MEVLPGDPSNCKSLCSPAKSTVTSPLDGKGLSTSSSHASPLTRKLFPRRAMNANIPPSSSSSAAQPELIIDSVDFAKRLSSTSSSRSQQELAIKIKKTHNLTIILQNGSERLLKEYITCQGPPFGTPSFSIPIQPFPGLPLPSLSAKARLDVSDGGRLQESAQAFSNLPAFLTTVLRQQTLLNPEATGLHQQLDASQMQCLGLANNLTSIMASMGITSGPVVPPEPPEEDNIFVMKTVGYQICQLYQLWAKQCQEDLALLVAKYPV